MKRLQLKIQDLTNPTLLGHHEIKNIMGGSGTVSGSGLNKYTCTFSMTPGPDTQYTCFAETVDECQNAANESCGSNDPCTFANCN